MPADVKREGGRRVRAIVVVRKNSGVEQSRGCGVVFVLLFVWSVEQGQGELSCPVANCLYELSSSSSSPSSPSSSRAAVNAEPNVSFMGGRFAICFIVSLARTASGQ